jgi:cytochrome b subunit of formate dehydrogenase
MAWQILIMLASAAVTGVLIWRLYRAEWSGPPS